jgi:arylsulfatase
VTKHRTPWETTGDVTVAFDDDVWELYDGENDPTQRHNIAAEHPDKLHELQRLFVIEAARYNVLPLDDRGFERVLPEISGRPVLVGDHLTLRPGMGSLQEIHIPNMRNKSWTIAADVTIPAGGANGVLVSLGGHAGGWSFYLKAGVPSFTYNLFGLSEAVIRGAQELEPGRHLIAADFIYDGGGIGKGGAISISADGAEIAGGRIDATEGLGFGYEYTDVGRDAQSPVTSDYLPGPTEFTGIIHSITLDAGKDAHDHLIDNETRIRIAMSRQ